MGWNKQHIQDAAQAVIATRDFCGNEIEAIRQYRADYGLPKPAPVDSIMQKANALWLAGKKAAGVKAKYW